MVMLADLVQIVIGVDTHKHTHTAAVMAAGTGQTVAMLTVATNPGGYRQLLELADRQPGRRVWAAPASVVGPGGATR